MNDEVDELNAHYASMAGDVAKTLSNLHEENARLRQDRRDAAEMLKRLSFYNLQAHSGAWAQTSEVQEELAALIKRLEG